MASSDQIGTQKLGPFMLLERVGGGSTGIVYKSQHTKTNQVVAVKVLSACIARNRVGLVRFNDSALSNARDEDNLRGWFSDEGDAVSVRYVAIPDHLSHCNRGATVSGGIVGLLHAYSMAIIEMNRHHGTSPAH